MTSIHAAAGATDQRPARVAGVLRDIGRAGIAGLLMGVLVGGLGGRLVMMVVALLNPEAFGRRTENGELIGTFSINGTLALILFGGLAAGMVAAVVWVVIAPWVPWSGPRRWLVAMPIALALGAFLLVESTNRDFVIVGPSWLVLVLLLGLVAIAGFVMAWLDERLERRLPRVESNLRVALTLYGVLAILGLPGLLLTVAAFFSEGFATGPLPRGVGYALLVSGVATLALWAQRISSGQPEPPRSLALIGRAGLVAAVIMGLLHVAQEGARILSIA